MYKVYCDGTLIVDSSIQDLSIANPIVTLEANTAGEFTFIMPATHPFYDEVKRLTSVIEVYRDNRLIFRGFVSNESVDMFRNKSLICEGDLSYLNDSILRPALRNITSAHPVDDLLEAYITEHNAQVEPRKRFTLGTVTVTDPTGHIYCYTNMNNTLQEISEDLIDDYGGYIYVRRENGVNYIDYINDSTRYADQAIRLGMNLTDYNSNIDEAEIATRVIPLGSIKETQDIPNLDTRVDIKSVNGGIDYLESPSTVVEEYGIITKTLVLDGVTSPGILKTKGQKWLTDNQFENIVIEVSAIDLGLIDPYVDSFQLLDQVHVISEKHGLDRWFTLTKMMLNLNNPEQDVFTLGKKTKMGLAAKTNSAITATQELLDSVNEEAWLTRAKDEATALISGADGGFVVLNVDQYNRPYELLVMDTDNKDTATKVWRWNQNGFGYSSTGYNGTYGTAITMDGQIVANYVKTGTLVAQNNLFELNMITGHVKMKDGEFTGSVTSSSISSGSITGADISGGNLTGAIISNGNKFYVSADGGVTASAINITDGNIELARDSAIYPTKYISILGRVPQSTAEAGVRLNAGGNIDVQQGTYHTYIRGYGSDLQGNVNIGGNLNVLGTVKQRVISTEHYGQVGLSAYETPKPTFADEGHGQLDENGVCYIYLNDVFLETIDTIHRYRVFLTKYGQGDIWVDTVDSNCVIIKGDPFLEFDWKVDCAQKGHNVSFLEPFKGNDDYNATDMSYESMTDQYLHYYESEVLTNESNY
jgi:phage minor structural protein